MSQTRYGIRRFALLNTAGYSLGIFPLENPLSIYGANNLGKSASINALQFPILARLSDMSFGKYSMEQSRRFYFASDTSYILLELMLPHGPHVIGVAGRGPGGGFGHQFFAYAGEPEPGPLPEERYLPAPARAVRQPRARRHQGLRGEAGRSCAACWSAGTRRSRST